MSIYNEQIWYELPNTKDDIKQALNSLYKHQIISCDINTSSQFFGDSNISTISFAWSKNQGIAFQFNKELLTEFFFNYSGSIIWNNSNINLKHLVYNLYMTDYLDYKGMLEGIDILTKSFEDTKLMAYLATNNCKGNKLTLEEQSYEYSLNCFKKEKDDIKSSLMKALSIYYVYDKYNSKIDLDNQRELYEGLFKDSVRQILQMELVGMPIHMPSVNKAHKRLNRLHKVYTNFLNVKLKDVGHPQINPNSDNQVRDFLYGFCQLPIIDRTKKGNPATNTKALEKLNNHCKSSNRRMIMRCLIHLSKISNILTSFLPNLVNATLINDGSYRLYGNFNLGGTVSGRLSSNNPNLHGIPSSSEYSNLIKDCFRSTKVFGGADFSSLESVVNALVTKDPNKLEELMGGFDSHCYRMVRYWPDKFKHININDVNQVNNLKYTHSMLRTDSKPVSFALQYFGEPITLQRNCGFSVTESQVIYDNYHNLYKVSDRWVESKLVEAYKKSFSTLAFGLRLRTPYMGDKEERTVGNAVSGQSYSLLNNRAANEFRERVLNSKYKYDIQIIALIHDAIYLEWTDRMDITVWVNNNLIECMHWNELPELQHDIVKLDAQLDIFYPSWSNAIGIKYNATEQQIIEEVRK